MRALLAASVIAAALVLAPIQARLEPLASAVEAEADANALAHTAAQSGESPQDAMLDAFERALSAWLSGSDRESDADLASVPPQSAAPAASADAICAALDQSASQNDLPLDFFTRLIWQESRFNPFSISHAGAQGIAQFMPATARRVGLANPFDPVEALPKSAELLRDLRTQFGNLGLAAAAYNAGPKRVEDWLAKRKVLPQETEAYVRIITGRSAQQWTSADAAGWGVAVPAPGPCAQLANPAPGRPQPVIAASRPDRAVHPVVPAHQADRPVAVAHRESIRCCRLPAHGVKLAHSESSVADRESIRCCRLPAHGVKLAHLESSMAAPKSIIAAPKGGHARPHLIGPAPAHGSTAEAPHAPRREQPAGPHRKPAPSAHPARLA
jgi:soluble lytic murein transglycosylase-like protein